MSIVTLAKPVTHKDRTPESLLGQLVRVRPYYHVPSGPYSLTSTRSPWTHEALVITAHSEMVVVRFTWDTNSAPWRRECVFYPRELHMSRGCECPACKVGGAGLQELHGA